MRLLVAAALLALLAGAHAGEQGLISRMRERREARRAARLARLEPRGALDEFGPGGFSLPPTAPGGGAGALGAALASATAVATSMGGPTGLLAGKGKGLFPPANDFAPGVCAGARRPRAHAGRTWLPRCDGAGRRDGAPSLRVTSPSRTFCRMPPVTRRRRR